jgi:long-subunit fatty acid transport protein
VPTNVGVDTISGLQNAESDSISAALSFSAFTLPRGRMTLGFFQHRVARFRADLQSNGIFLDRPYVDRIEPFRGSMSLDISDFGASAGVRLSDQLSVGGTLAIYHFKMKGKTDRFYIAPFTGGNPFPYPDSQRNQFTQSGEWFGPANFTPSNEFLTVTDDGSGTNVGFNLGTLYRAPRWSVGAAYRYAPKFHYNVTTIVPTSFSPAAVVPNDPGVFFSTFKNQIFDQEQATFDVPDTLALGLTVRPRETLVASFEYTHVAYSQISDHTVEVFGIEEHDAVNGKAIADQIRAGLHFPDANQVHAGLEYVIVRPGPDVALRIGGWFDPNHRLQFDGTDPRIRALFRPGPDEWHLAPGAGFTFNQFQIDAAFDVSKRINTFAVSGVFWF